MKKFTNIRFRMLSSQIALITTVFLNFTSFANTCADAISITSCGTTETGSTLGEPNTNFGTCGTAVGTGGMQWYTFVGDGNDWTFETVTTTGEYDTKIWVFSGSCGALNCITGNDDSNGTLSLVNFTASAGIT